jgi:hypothetical protein
MSTTDELDRLVDQVCEAQAGERNQARLQLQARPRLNVGYENPIAWVRLFGYDPVRYFSDPQFRLEWQLRQKLWAFRQIEDDVPITCAVPAWLGHYPEYTFFGMHVGVMPHGGPEIQTDHPMTREPALSLLPPVDFRGSGWMPLMIEWYERLIELADGRLDIPFFAWNRGCLDLAVQLRGYENLLLDTMARPDFVHDLLKFLTQERCRWHDAAADYLGQPVGPTFVADDWVAVPYISPSIFADFVLPRYLEIEAHHGVFAGFHSCGDQTALHPSMLQIKTLGTYEVSPWMTVGAALESLPPDKHLGLAVHPNDVVVDALEEMARKHRARAEALRGTERSFSYGTSGLTPLHDEADFVRRVNTWLRLAREAFTAP